MSNETKIGLMATIIIAVFIWGFKYIQGRNLFSSNTQILVEFDTVDELQVSAPVLKNGLEVGTVTDIYFKTDDMDKVIINLDIDSDLRVPTSAKAILYNQSVMGGKAVKLIFSKPCAGANCVESGQFIQGVGKGLLGSLVDPTEIPAYMEQLTEGGRALASALDSTLSNPEAQKDGLGKVVADLAGTLENLKTTTYQLNKLLSSSQASLSGTFANVEAITANIKNNDARIDQILANFATLSNSIKDMDLKTTVDKTNGTLSSAKVTMDDLQGTLKKANTTFDGINVLLADIKAGKGSLGKLATDEEMYNKLTAAGKQVELLLEDVRLHPKRYTRFLSKKEVPYEAPTGN